MSRATPGYLCSAADDEEGGLYACRLHDDGRLELGSHVSVSGATFLALGPDGDHCYLVREGADPQVVACRLDDLTELNRQPAGGGAPAYVSVDATGQYVFVANYLGGNVRVFPIAADGRLDDPVETVAYEGSSVNPDRQTASHPHCIRPGPANRFVYVTDLGTDDVRIYRFDAETGAFDPVGAVSVHDGAGPRHLAFGPGETAYLLNELDATLTVFDRDADTGDLTAVETVETLPAAFEGDNLAADVHVHPSGEWLYASNRGHDSVAIFAVDGAGRLDRVGHASTRGEYPRNVALAPSGTALLAENERSDSVITFDLDPDSGALAYAGHELSVPRPMCLVFAGAD